MTTPGMDTYNERKYLSITSLISFSRCPMKYFLSTGQRLRQSIEHPALNFGSAIHEAVPLILRDDLDGGLEAFDKVWQDGDALGDDKRNSKRARLMMMDLYERTRGGRGLFIPQPPPENRVRLEGDRSPYEIPFAVDIGLDVPLVGWIDDSGRHRATNELYGVEIKTSSEISSRFITGFELHPQVLGYALALKTLTGESVKGTFVLALQVAKVKIDTLMHPFDVSDHQLDMFVKWARWQGALLLECEKRGEFTKNICACTPYPMYATPGYQCDYIDLCKVEDWRELSFMFKFGEGSDFAKVVGGEG